MPFTMQPWLISEWRATDHGPTGNDELNVIRAGANYGWPVVEGQAGDDRFAPVVEAFRASLSDQHVDGHRLDVRENVRFKGGHITRHYGRPAEHIHAVQLEQCWSSYMREAPPYAWDEAIAARVQPLLRRLLQTMLAWRP